MDIDKAQFADLVAEIVRKVSQQLDHKALPSVSLNASVNVAGSASVNSRAAYAPTLPIVAPSARPHWDSVPSPEFDSVDEMIAAVRNAQEQWVKLGREKRIAIVQALRDVILRHAQELANMAVRETRMGLATDKLLKIQASAKRTPGLETLASASYSDDQSLHVTEPYPYGVIASFVPCTNPVATVVHNAICMVSAGNGVVFSPHPRCAQCCRQTVIWLQEALGQAGGPRHLITVADDVSAKGAEELLHHPAIDCLVMHGNERAAQAALSAGRKCIVAGPGNPPCVIADDADIATAAQCLVTGAAFDCNLLSCSEKAAIVVEGAYRDLVNALLERKCVMLTLMQFEDITRVLFPPPPVGQTRLTINEAWRGLRPCDITRAIGLEIPTDTRLLLAEADRDHPLVHAEQLMPIMPLVRVRHLDEALELALRVENQRGHTVVIHGHRNEAIARWMRRSNCAIAVQNGSSLAGVGLSGGGPVSFTVATATGEGITTPLTFTHRCRRIFSDI